MSKNKKHLTEHHTIPISRNGKGSKRVLVDGRFHSLYSQLFQMQNHRFKTVEMLPEEIVEWLNETFWDNAYDIEMIKRRRK